MAFLRLISRGLRLAQLITAAVVLGLTSYFMHELHQPRVGPFACLFYSVVIAAISVCLSLVWAISANTSLTQIGSDFVSTGAWFAVFAVLQDYFDDGSKCGSTWAWNNLDVTNNYCGQWNTAKAFAFLAAMFFLASFIVCLLAWDGARQRASTAEGVPAR